MSYFGDHRTQRRHYLDYISREVLILNQALLLKKLPYKALQDSNANTHQIFIFFTKKY